MNIHLKFLKISRMNCKIELKIKCEMRINWLTIISKTFNNNETIIRWMNQKNKWISVYLFKSENFNSLILKRL